MRIVLAVVVAVAIGLVFAQAPMVKIGPGGQSVVEVVCRDAMRRLDPVSQRELERRFRSDIVVRCTAEATLGVGRIAAGDFAYRSRYTLDESVKRLSQSNFTGQLGEVYGESRREFYIGLPNFSRPWVIVLYFDGDATQIVFGTNP